MENSTNVETNATIANILDELVQQLYQEFARKFRLEEQTRQERGTRLPLPQEVLEEMEQFSMTELSNKLKRYTRDLQQYDGNDWTTTEYVNDSFVPQLKKH
ncbi:hypothetical protein EC973_005649 [Apophysomyces ossiformis]|uniref:Uncharacterized protein n=1 Tax=Apophysomyces ossiformis TaxID=679940 RepID=A0A8H7BH74_9FUNG|nr:hypothetical protein EC973_005649 [Apophysomyces ossiformis]